MVTVPVPDPSQTWSWPRHISGPGLCPGPVIFLVPTLVPDPFPVKISGLVTQWLCCAVLSCAVLCPSTTKPHQGGIQFFLQGGTGFKALAVIALYWRWCRRIWSGW